MSKPLFTPTLTPRPHGEIGCLQCLECKHLLFCTFTIYDSLHCTCQSYEQIQYWSHDTTIVDKIQHTIIHPPKFDVMFERITAEVIRVENHSIEKGNNLRKVQRITFKAKGTKGIHELKATYWGESIKVPYCDDDIHFQLKEKNIFSCILKYKPNTYKTKKLREILVLTMFSVFINAENKWDLDEEKPILNHIRCRHCQQLIFPLLDFGTYNHPKVIFENDNYDCGCRNVVPD